MGSTLAKVVMSVLIALPLVGLADHCGIVRNGRQVVLVPQRSNLALVDGGRSYYHLPTLKRQDLAASYANDFGDYLRFLEFKAYQAGLSAARSDCPPAQPGQASAVEQPAPTPSALMKNCGACHGPTMENPKAGLRINEITCDQTVKFLAWLGSVSDVPADKVTMKNQVARLRSLPAVEKQEILAELLAITQGVK